MKRKALHDLPVEIAGAVLGCLEVDEACAARGVCATMRKVRPQWKKIRLCKPNDSDVHKVLATCVPACVQKIDLDFDKVHPGDNGFREIVHFPNLTDLVLRLPKNFPMNILASFAHLRSLELETCEISSLCFSHIATLPLEFLKFVSRDRHTKRAIAHIGKCASLRRLELVFNALDKDVAHLAELVNLEHLSIEGALEVTDAGLVAIANLGRLRVLHLAECFRVTDAGLANLARLDNLEDFKIGGSKITSLASLAGLVNLKKLDLWGSVYLTNTGLACVSQLPELKTLSLYYCRGVTNSGLGCLQGLHDLNIKGAFIDDGGLLVVSKMTSLTTLSFGSCQISDNGLAHLAALENLRNLHLGFMWDVTDAGIAHLRALHLNNLRMPYTNFATKQAIAWFVSAGVKVSFE